MSDLASGQQLEVVPQELNLGPVLFSIFMGNLDDVTKCALSKFAGDTKLRAVSDTSNDGALIQSHPEKLKD